MCVFFVNLLKFFQFYTVSETTKEGNQSTNVSDKQEVGRPIFSSTPAASVRPGQIRGRRLEMGSFKPEEKTKQPQPEIIENNSQNQSADPNKPGTQLKRGIARRPPPLRPLVKPSILHFPTSSHSTAAQSDYPSLVDKNKEKELSADPVAFASKMWAERDAKERQVSPVSASVDPVSAANARWAERDADKRQSDTRVHFVRDDSSKLKAIKDNSVTVKAEIHRADDINKGDEEGEINEGAYVTVPETEESLTVSVKDHHPQNQEIIDLSEQEVKFGKKTTGGLETSEDTEISNSLINQIASWQVTKISHPMEYRTKSNELSVSDSDKRDSEDSDHESNTFGLYD